MMRSNRVNDAAFTLLEVMIVCGLVAVLMAMAIPSYRQYVVRAHRSAAIEQLLSAVGCQQRIYAAEFHFDTRRCLPPDEEGRYEFRFEPEDSAEVGAFTVTADPLASQASDVCGSLSLDHRGAKQISGPSERSAACWQSR